ncbi:pentapeptide repeat-containing protein [Streptomyces uncialis]|uniref:pentapeptide repeat-containing protein n=1 Tax=Streptomyces uncialis TaxID=1048205 RepID=UPI002E37BA3A|nr:pentapeptide repeat-containing protein [Streptomyces uncialis]
MGRCRYPSRSAGCARSRPRNCACSLGVTGAKRRPRAPSVRPCRKLVGRAAAAVSARAAPGPVAPAPAATVITAVARTIECRESAPATMSPAWVSCGGAWRTTCWAGSYVRSHAADKEHELPSVHDSSWPILSQDDSADMRAALTVLAFRDPSHDRDFRPDPRGTRLDSVELVASGQRAVLRDARPPGMSLIHAALIHADLSGADLHGSTLSGADLAGVKLTGAQLTAHCLGPLARTCPKAVERRVDIDAVSRF